MVDLTAITPVGPLSRADWLHAMVTSLREGNPGLAVEVVFIAHRDVETAVQTVATRHDTVLTTTSRNVAHCRNMGLRKSNARYVAQFDADDVHIPGGATLLVEHLDTHTSTPAAYGAAQDVNVNLEPLGEMPMVEKLWNVSQLAQFRASTIDTRPPMGFYPMLGCAGIIRKSTIGDGWDERGSGSLYEDNELLIRLAASGGVQTLNRPVLLYRKHETSLMATRNTTDEMRAAARLKELEQQYAV